LEVKLTDGGKMETIETTNALEKGGYALQFDLGTFEGFNFRQSSAIDRVLTGDEVVNWDHDANGEAEFWPSGDNAGVSMVFKDRSAVTGQELLDLDKVLQELGDDSTLNFLRIHHAVNIHGTYLNQLTGEQVENQNIHVFMGTSFLDLRREAAYELFELYYPEAYAMWEATPCDGLIFDTDVFLDSPSWSVQEVEFSDGQKALVMEAQ
jgi:hypothetical protein